MPDHANRARYDQGDATLRQLGQSAQSIQSPGFYRHLSASKCPTNAELLFYRAPGDANQRELAAFRPAAICAPVQMGHDLSAGTQWSYALHLVWWEFPGNARQCPQSRWR